MEGHSKEDRLYLFVIVTSLYMYVMTWILSICAILNRYSVMTGWLLFTIGIAIIWCSNRKIQISIIAKNHISDRKQRAVFILLSIFSLIILWHSWYMPLINYDSLTYHLPRIMHWIQNQSVEYYMTSIPRQLFNGAFAEYWMMHIFLLTLSEKSYSIVQFAAYMISAQAIYSICKMLKINQWYSYIAVVFWLTSPIALAEALSTQNDIVAGMWTILGVYYVLGMMTVCKAEYSNVKKEIWHCFVCLSICTAFGYLTKGTAPLTLIAFWGGGGLVLIYRERWKLFNALKMLIVAVAAMGILILPTCIDNYRLWSSIFALENYDNVLIGKISPRYILVNIVKNIGLHMGSSLTWLNHYLEKAILGLTGLFRIEIQDPAITFNPAIPYAIAPSYDWDSATVPLLLGSILISSCVLLYCWKRNDWLQKCYICMVLSACVIVFGSIKFQPWITRLTIPVTIAASILPALAIEKCKVGFCKYFLVTGGIICALLTAFMSGDYLFKFAKMNESEGEYEISEPTTDLQKALKEVIEDNMYDKVGIIIGSDTVEYPIWHTLMENGICSVQIEHICLPEKISYLEKIGERQLGFEPDCIVVGNREDYSKNDVFIYNGMKYDREFCSDDGRFLIYVKDE